MWGMHGLPKAGASSLDHANLVIKFFDQTEGHPVLGLTVHCNFVSKIFNHLGK
jgi:hypothetical protein